MSTLHIFGTGSPEAARYAWRADGAVSRRREVPSPPPVAGPLTPTPGTLARENAQRPRSIPLSTFPPPRSVRPKRGGFRVVFFTPDGRVTRRAPSLAMPTRPRGQGVDRGPTRGARTRSLVARKTAEPRDPFFKSSSVTRACVVAPLKTPQNEQGTVNPDG